ncbi:MAG TPA: class D sortase [Thermoanaerobaculia bacterium]|nr:class D sortase [Thermoanaerobaculia bacterium]
MRIHRFFPITNLLLVAGVLLLIPPATHWFIAERAQERGAAALEARSQAPESRRAGAREGEPIGRLTLPRVGLDAVVFEGTSESTLRKGPGHLRGTGWPGDGAPSSCVISAHRDTFFRRLEGARAGDLVRLHGGGRAAIYRLETRRVVKPEDVGALSPLPGDRLTLVTCYPFHFLGAAPYRLIWTARREDDVAARDEIRDPGRR